MKNRQRFPLMLDGERVMLDAGVEDYPAANGRIAPPWGYVELGHRALIPPTHVPPEGMRVPVALPGGRHVTIVFGPAKSHWVSLEL